MASRPLIFLTTIVGILYAVIIMKIRHRQLQLTLGLAYITVMSAVLVAVLSNY